MNSCHIKSKNPTMKCFTYHLIFLYLLLSSASLCAKNQPSVNDLFEKANAAFIENKLDQAEKLIEKLLESSQNEAEYHYLAGRIAGKQAQEANIFSKLSYAKAAKKYFTEAIKIDPQHQDAIVGLIRFHQQAPVMAGSDKHMIPELFKQLRSVDARTAFLLQAPMLLEKKPFEFVQQLYVEALELPSKHHSDQFKLDAAMWFSAYGHYKKALEIMQSIDSNDNQLNHESAAMRLYQMAKLTAETQSQLDVGIKNIQLYAALPAQDKTISQDWVAFRLAQLNFLKHQLPADKKQLMALESITEQDNLRDQIKSFLSNY